MSKLPKIKKWLSIPRAADYLSDTLNEEILPPDVLQLVLDGHLALSVKFNVPVVAHRYSPDNVNAEFDYPYKETERIDGVFDLLLSPQMELEIKREYSKMTDSRVSGYLTGSLTIIDQTGFHYLLLDLSSFEETMKREGQGWKTFAPEDFTPTPTFPEHREFVVKVESLRTFKADLQRHNRVKAAETARADKSAKALQQEKLIKQHYLKLLESNPGISKDLAAKKIQQSTDIVYAVSTIRRKLQGL